MLEVNNKACADQKKKKERKEQRKPKPNKQNSKQVIVYLKMCVGTYERKQ